MKENVLIRRGKPEDARHFSELALFTGPVLLPALFGSESNAGNVLSRSFRHDRNTFSYEHSYFIEVNGETAGMGLAFTCEQMKKEQIRSMLFILRYLKLRFFTRIIYLYRSSNIMVQITEGDSYLAHIALYPQYRRLGLGTKLLQRIEEEARALGSEKMVMDVETDNGRAIELYKRLGYRIESESPVLRIKAQDFEFYKMIRDI